MLEYSQALFIYTALIKVVDALTVVGVWYGCWYFRFYSEWIPVTRGLPPLSQYSRMAFPLAVVFTGIFHILGAYRRDRISFGFRSIKKNVESTVVGTLVFISVLYFFRQQDFSRAFLAIFPIFVMVGIVLERLFLHGIWVSLHHRTIRKIRICLVGEGGTLELYVKELQSRMPYPVEWVGRLGREGDLQSIAYLGSEENLIKVLRENRVDTVVISYPAHESHKTAPILQTLSNELVGIRLLPDFGKFSTFAYSADQECGIPLLLFNHVPVGTSDRVLKRAIDILGALVFLAFFSPLFGLIATLVRFTSKGPVFYRQTRLGADGRYFELYKFRSMSAGAEERTGAVWAKPNDPRVTLIGKWLRKTSLDELPQFWNVLKGDMSLVGPRPERPVFVEQFRSEVPKYMLRHRVKSGLTGWAQVNGWRGNTSIEERIKFDLYYIGHWSHFLDLKILCMTLWRGFIHRHAY